MNLDCERLFRDALDGEHGFPRSLLDELSQRFNEIQDEIRLRRLEGEYGFLDLGVQDATIAGLTTFADTAGQAFDHVLVLGIGGSALGTKALVNALRPRAWNELDDEAREYFPRITVLENIDPVSVSAALRRIDPRRVLVNVVSKSGGTAETLAQYLVVRHWLETAVGPEAAPKHLVFTTDPVEGALRRIADDEGIPAFEIPPGVGGRFSVLSPVGLLPAALVGIDVVALLRGARRALEAAAHEGLRDNPAALYAGLHWAADTRLGARTHVLMPYSDGLRELAEWFRQLWAESLGKRVNRHGEIIHAGPTPLGAIGATDQHSQVQLFMEGPHDKVITFVRVEDHGEDVLIPARSGQPEALEYLGGKTLAGLLGAEQDATEKALAQVGRLSVRITLPRVDAEEIGELLMFFQLATGYAGAWYGVNPFDQPGVELGKRLTFQAMGRSGFGNHDEAAMGGARDS